MLDIKKVSLGNWLINTRNKSYVKVTGINNLGKISFNNYDWGMPISDIKPIPLNTDTIKLLGCKIGCYYISLTSIEAELHFEFYSHCCIVTLKGNYTDLIIEHIDHIHDVQNVFKQLTNEDLTIDLSNEKIPTE